jgi:hypothetical protein
VAGKSNQVLEYNTETVQAKKPQCAALTCGYAKAQIHEDMDQTRREKCDDKPEGLREWTLWESKDAKEQEIHISCDWLAKHLMPCDSRSMSIRTQLQRRWCLPHTRLNEYISAVEPNIVGQSMGWCILRTTQIIASRLYMPSIAARNRQPKDTMKRVCMTNRRAVHPAGDRTILLPENSEIIFGR